jgi:hypothetical protein
MGKEAVKLIAPAAASMISKGNDFNKGIDRL